VGYSLSLLCRFILLAFVVLTNASIGNAQWHVTGLVGTMTRVQADVLNFTSFHSGPESTTTPVLGVEGGRSIWKVTVDGTLLTTSTGESETIIGPAAQFRQTTKGHALLFDGGGEYPLLHISGFQVLARVGYGTARVHVPTEIPIADHRQFWNYGVVGTRNVGKRYIVRIDVRNVHFRREEVPETLGRFNVTASVGFGWRF
jgi:hypothetical protein